MSGYEYAPSTKRRLNQMLDKPWRYRCPDCGSTEVLIRRKLGQPADYIEIEPTKAGKPAPTREDVRDFRCGECNNTFDKPYDAKTEKQQLVQLEGSDP